MSTSRPVLAALLLLSTGCSQLAFLKAPSVPQPRGASSLERGAAYLPSPVGRVDTLADWPAYNRSLEGHRGSPLADIVAPTTAGSTRSSGRPWTRR